MTVAEAARVIRDGGVVAFPTETVYGLGANALDERAVLRIYELKGRPATSPLIVHVASIEEARALAVEWPDAAQRLAERYWPGPLTIVVRKHPSIPDIVTAGLPTAGFRIPQHPVAQELLRAAAVPVAAPSANKFTGVSPTTAEHVRAAFGDAVPVLEGGPSRVGIESTVVAVEGDRIRLLRPGMIRIPEALLSEVNADPKGASGSAHESPGQHARHYAPKTLLALLNPGDALPANAAYVYWRMDRAEATHRVRLPDNPAAYAEALYRTLHELDAGPAGRFAVIAIEPVPPDAEWDAVRDRLRRASTG